MSLIHIALLLVILGYPGLIVSLLILSIIALAQWERR